jgi:hypothetical protein
VKNEPDPLSEAEAAFSTAAEDVQAEEHQQIQRDTDTRKGSSEEERNQEAESGPTASGRQRPSSSAPDSSGAFFCNGTGASAPRRENPLWFLVG